MNEVATVCAFRNLSKEKNVAILSTTVFSNYPRVQINLEMFNFQTQWILSLSI